MALHTATGLGCASMIHAQTVEIPSSWSYPLSSANTGEPGFIGNARQARSDGNLSANIPRGNAHLKDELIDPLTSLPYANTLVDTANPDVGTEQWPGDFPINPDGTFVLDTVINFSGDSTGRVTDPEEGNFTTDTGFPDGFFPGFPGENSEGSGNADGYNNGLNYSVEFLGFIQLPAGETTLVLRNDDASQVAIHPNDARDIFRTGLIESTGNNLTDDRRVTVNVAQAGLYSIRVMLAQWMTSSNLEFYVDNGDSLSLVNAPATAGSADLPEITVVRENSGDISISWTPVDGVLLESPDLVEEFLETTSQDNPQTVTPAGSSFFRVLSVLGSPAGPAMWRSISEATRPYVTDISPDDAQSGVDSATNISITMQNLGSEVPVMRVNGSSVTFTSTTNGSETVLTYDPVDDFSGAETVTVELDYGNASASWDFITATGNKAILISGGGDAALAQRLATDFNLDVEVFSDTANVQDVLDAAVDARLIFHSSTVSSGNAFDLAVALRDLPVPIACVENGNADEFFLGGATPAERGNIRNEPNVDIVILDTGHPTAGGLAAGTYPLVTSAEVQQFAIPYPEMVRVADSPVLSDNSSLPIITAVESGTEVDGGAFRHLNRRVYCGAFGNDGVSKLTPDGETIFNAVITWLLAGEPADP